MNAFINDLLGKIIGPMPLERDFGGLNAFSFIRNYINFDDSFFLVGTI